jgi:hypothetical protein
MAPERPRLSGRTLLGDFAIRRSRRPHRCFGTSFLRIERSVRELALLMPATADEGKEGALRRLISGVAEATPIASSDRSG